MTLLRRRVAATAVLGAATLALPAVRAQATRVVHVWSSTDQAVAQPVLDDFERHHRGWRIRYLDLGSAELYERFLAEGPAAKVDVLWSSAMDLQIKLANDGHAARHVSVHAARLPRWAVWKHEAYATTHEPVGLAYHRGRIAVDEVPHNHAALAALLRSDPARFRRRVVTYDIQRAGLGYLLAAHDAMASPQAWDLVAALGESGATLHADSQAMLGDVAAGRALLAYNVLGTYADGFAKLQPDVAVAYPRDYTLVASRVALIARQAGEPEGARLWLDHLISPAGQQVLADQCGLYAVMAAAGPSPRSGAALHERFGSSLRPIALGPGLLAHLDQSKRRAFLARWQQALRVAR